MISCLGFPHLPAVLAEEQAIDQVELCEIKERNARITAYALTIIALILFVLACFLFGLATVSPEFTMGLGFIPSLAGAFIGTVGGGVFMGALFFHILASVRGCQRGEMLYLRND